MDPAWSFLPPLLKRFGEKIYGWLRNVAEPQRDITPEQAAVNTNSSAIIWIGSQCRSTGDNRDFSAAL